MKYMCLFLFTLPPKSKHFLQVLLFYQSRAFPRRDLFILLSVCAVSSQAKIPFSMCS